MVWYDNMEIERGNCIYTECYCEENIWKLCEKILCFENRDLIQSCWVIFISNEHRCVPIWNQRKANEPGTAVFWDYHVVLLFGPESTGTADIFDFDTVLPFPCRLDVYLADALRPNRPPTAPTHQLRTVLRLIPGRLFLEVFASDRSHMWNQMRHQYNSPPPNYPCICTKTCDNNLQEFIDMTPGAGFGKVVALDRFASQLNSSNCLTSSEFMNRL